WKCAFEIVRRDGPHAFERFAVDSLVSAHQLGDRTGPMQPRGRRGAEVSFHRNRGHDALDLGEVPGQLPQRPALRIGAEVVLVVRQRLQQPQGDARLVLPTVEEALDFMARHGNLSSRYDTRALVNVLNQLATSRRRLVYRPRPSAGGDPRRRSRAK